MIFTFVKKVASGRLSLKMQGTTHLASESLFLSEKYLAVPEFCEMRLIYFGDSHAHALIRAKAKLGVGQDLDAIDVRRIENPAANAKNIPSNLAETFPADAIFCCLGGTEYNLLGLIESIEPYDFFLHPGDTILPGRKILSNGMVRSILDARMQSARRRTEQVRAQFDCRFACVAPPPPFAALNGGENLPRAFMPLLDRGISPPSIRRKWYTMQIAMLEQDCRATGTEFLKAPKEVQDEFGYLRREYWDTDPTHGNATYGKAVIDQIRSYCDG